MRVGGGKGIRCVVDVTNFTNRTDFRGSRENLHLVERYTRTGDTLTYQVTVEDPTTWAQPWTALVELDPQDNTENFVFRADLPRGGTTAWSGCSPTHAPLSGSSERARARIRTRMDIATGGGGGRR